MNASIEKRAVYFTMVQHPVKGWMRVGSTYKTRESAAEWLPFVRKCWRMVCRVRVSQCTLRLVNGELDEKSKRVLDTKFNMDAP